MLRTRITAQYRLEFPLIGTDTAFVPTAEVTAAVSNAGGLGMLGVSPQTPEALRAAIRAVKALTRAPFGVPLPLSHTESDHIEVCVQERLSVVSFCGSEPPDAFITRLR